MATRRPANSGKSQISANSPDDIASRENVDDVDENSEIVTFRYEITSYGADYPVDGLVKRINAGDIVIPTFDPVIRNDDMIEGFQRRFVWTTPQCDRFIESLLLGLPVPGIFLVKQDDGRLLVLDGQQRLRTLQHFYKGTIRGKEYRLENVQEVFKHKTYESLESEDRRRLDDSIIHATIVKQDLPSDDQSSIYLIFERLNTGGTTLYPQEIRVALYRGKFVQLLREMNDISSWRSLYGPKSNRLKDQELILRFFSLLYWQDKYQRPMKEFLNKFIAKNRNLDLVSADELGAIFSSTCDIIQRALGDSAFKLKKVVNAAVLDSVMVGVARRISSSKAKIDTDVLVNCYKNLLKNKDYLLAVERATADEDSVGRRLRLATEAFSEV
jgi:Protein of unknown function DUF262